MPTTAETETLSIIDGDRLRQFMEMKGSNPAKIAAATGLGYSTIMGMLAEKTPDYRLSKAAKVARALGISIESMLRPEAY